MSSSSSQASSIPAKNIIVPDRFPFTFAKFSVPVLWQNWLRGKRTAWGKQQQSRANAKTWKAGWDQSRCTNFAESLRYGSTNKKLHRTAHGSHKEPRPCTCRTHKFYWASLCQVTTERQLLVLRWWLWFLWIPCKTYQWCWRSFFQLYSALNSQKNSFVTEVKQAWSQEKD